MPWHHAVSKTSLGFSFFSKQQVLDYSEPFFNHWRSEGKLTTEHTQSQAEPPLVRLPANVGVVWTALGTHAHLTTLCARWHFRAKSGGGGAPLVRAAGHYCSCWHQGQIWKWDIHLYRLTVLTQRPAVEGEEDISISISFIFAGRCCWNMYMRALVVSSALINPKPPFAPCWWTIAKPPRLLQLLTFKPSLKDLLMLYCIWRPFPRHPLAV